MWDQFAITITRFDTAYPKEEPDSYVVGFTVTCNANGRNMYQDVRVPYADVQAGTTDQDIAAAAWARLAASFESWACCTKVTQRPLVGSAFTPSLGASAQGEDIAVQVPVAAETATVVMADPEAVVAEEPAIV